MCQQCVSIKKVLMVHLFYRFFFRPLKIVCGPCLSLEKSKKIILQKNCFFYTTQPHGQLT